MNYFYDKNLTKVKKKKKGNYEPVALKCFWFLRYFGAAGQDTVVLAVSVL